MPLLSVFTSPYLLAVLALAALAALFVLREPRPEDVGVPGMEFLRPGFYRHYKGLIYEVVDYARMPDTGRLYVVARGPNGAAFLYPPSWFNGNAFSRFSRHKRFVFLGAGHILARSPATLDQAMKSLRKHPLQPLHGPKSATVIHLGDAARKRA